jgi:hypothetical protein
MRITTKKIRVISMTQEEMREFQELMQKAAEGRTVNYAEKQLADGTFLGVSVEETYDQTVPTYGNISTKGKIAY